MVDAWKPIDTAPKDGRPIFAMGHNYGNPKAGEHRCWCWWDGMNWRSVGDGSEEPAELLYLFVWWDPSADGGLNPTGFAESLRVAGEKFVHRDGTVMGRAGKRVAGRLLEGVVHDAQPAASGAARGARDRDRVPLASACEA